MDRRQYENFHKNAEHLRNKVNDLIDDAQHELGRELLELSHRITSEARLQKNPRSIESTVNNALGTLHKIRAQGDQVMDFRHTDLFIKGYQGLIMDLRQFENY